MSVAVKPRPRRPAVARFAAVATLALLLACPCAPPSAHAQAGECAPTWELDGELCYAPCPAGLKSAGPLCWQECPQDYTDEGTTCRRGAQVIEKNSQGRGAAMLTRSAYRDLFVRFVQLYRAGATFLAAPLTEDEKSFLRQFFPDRLVNRVRVAVVPDMTLPFVMNVRATTIGNDLVVVKDGQRTSSLLKHELVHVCQADKLGLDGFMREYADQFVDGGYQYNNIRFEKEAYAFEGMGGRISSHLGYCD